MFLSNLHGCGFLDPGYYMSFVSGAILNLTARPFRQYVRPIFMAPSALAPHKALYDVVGWLITNFFASFLVAPFFVLHFDKAVMVWGAYGFVPIWVLLAGFIGFQYLGLGRAIRSVGQGVFGAAYASSSKGKNDAKKTDDGVAADGKDGQAHAGGKETRSSKRKDA
jgi:hypothetical protein